MASEKFANLAETTLASSYTSGGSSISVSSASGFPTTGTFRVRLGNTSKTVYRVDSVSGTTFTGGAEANDGNSNSGDAVTLVVTKGSSERFLQSPESGYPTAPSGVDGVDRYGPIAKLVPLDQSGWSWFNQGSAVVTQGSDLVNLESPTATGTNIRGRLSGSYPSPTFTLIAVVRPKFQSAGHIAGLGCLGITISDGTKHKIFVVSNFNFNTADPPPAIWVGKYNSATSAVSATVIDSLLPAGSGVPVWLKVVDNNTNQIFSFSFNGVTYTQVLSETRTTHLTPSDIGIVIANQSGSQDAGGDILSWSLT